MELYEKEENPAYTMHELRKLERRVRMNKILVATYGVGAFALASANIIVTGTNNGMETSRAVSLAIWTCCIIISLCSAGFVIKSLTLDDNQRKLNRLIEKIRWNPAPLLGVVQPPADKNSEFNIFLKKNWWNKDTGTND